MHSYNITQYNTIALQLVFVKLQIVSFCWHCHGFGFNSVVIAEAAVSGVVVIDCIVMIYT